MKYLKLFEAIINDSFLQAAKRGSSTAIKKMIKDGVDINKKDEQFRTALMLASLNSFLMVVKILIEAGADVNIQDMDDRTALMMASTKSIVIELLNADIDVNIRNNEGETVMMEYLQYTLKDAIFYLEKFLEKGLDLDIKDYKGNNFYDILMKVKEDAYERHQKGIMNEKYSRIKELEEYMNKNFPQYKDEWELKKAVNDYNL
jgi:ankyrin repeat protein